jgi:hypothetical protein
MSFGYCWKCHRWGDDYHIDHKEGIVPSGQKLSSTKAINDKTGEIIDTEPDKILAPGFTAISGGIKHDESKRRMDLVPTSLVSSVARILEFGARKYGDNNWRKGLKWSRVYAALQRHLADFWEGNDLDSESGLPHLYHAACNIAFLIEFYDKRKDLDDRFHKPTITYYNSKTKEEIEIKPGHAYSVDNVQDVQPKKLPF